MKRVIAASRFRRFVSTAVACLLAGILIGRVGTVTAFAEKTAGPSGTAKSGPAQWGHVPLAFEANSGQAPDAVRYLARGAGYGVFFTDTETVFALAGTARTAVRMKVDGMNRASHPEGVETQPGSSHYFMNGNGTPTAPAPHYSKVRYREVLPGIDLLYYGSQRQVEYDFIVAPGALPSAIRMDFSGTDTISIEPNGDLKFSAAGGEIRHRQPTAFQEKNGRRQTVEVQFRRLGAQRVGFEVGSYDKNLPLTIDPRVEYATHWGGKNNDLPGELGFGITVDAAGSVYVTGITAATDYPLAAPLQNKIGGGFDAFVLKINSEGTSVLASTYIGGSSDDEGHDIKVDGSGNIYITGYTSSTDFPIVNGTQRTLGGGRDAYLVKLSPDAGSILYSTFIGGSAEDRGFGLAVSAGGDATITGMTQSRNFPILQAMQPNSGGGFSDAFVTRIASNGQAIYSTYAGGTGYDQGFDVTVDTDGNAYVGGFTTSVDFPRQTTVANGGLTQFMGGPDDGFALKLDASGALVFSIVIGGTGTDEVVGIAIDQDRNIYLTGYTASNDFPVWKPLQVFNGGNSDVFITKLLPDANQIDFSTYWGSTEGDGGVGIAVDNSGFIHVTGFTGSASFPLINAVQDRLNLGTASLVRDAFLLKLPSDGSSMVYSTYLGGRANDGALAIAVDGTGHTYLTGYTTSEEFPSINPLQPALADLQDAFVLKFDSSDIIAQIGAAVPAAGLASVSLGGLQRSALFGYADFAIAGGSPRPTGLEMITINQRGLTVSMLGLPVTPPMTRGSLFVQNMDVSHQESIAIVNAAGTAVTVSSVFTYSIADTGGITVGTQAVSAGTFILPTGGQLFILLTDSPFFLPHGLPGILTLDSTGPISVAVVSATINSQSNLILNRIPFHELGQFQADPTVIDYFIDGDGWTTELTLLNNTETPLSGQIRFLGPGNAATSSAVTINTTLGQESIFPYTILPGSHLTTVTTGAGTATTTGFIEIVPDSAMLMPDAFATIRKNESAAATLDAHRPVSRFRTYVESELNPGDAGSRRGFLAMTNTSSNDLIVHLDLTDSDGVYTGLSADITMPPRTEINRYLDEIPGFETTPKPFRGLLSGIVTVGTGLSVTGFSTLINEDLDLLITSTGPLREDAASASVTVFPYIPTGAQYTTRLLLFGPENGLATSGTVRMWEGGGHPLLLVLTDTRADVVPHPWAPLISHIEPPYGIAGTTTTVTFTGANFIAGSTTINALDDIDVTNVVVVNATTMTADFAVSAIASAGTRGVAVTTNGGSSGSAPFTFIVAAGPFPDLKPLRTHLGNGYVAGFNASDTIAIVNTGTALTTGDYTVTTSLSTGLAYVSSTGIGWTCSAGAETAGQMVTCSNSTPINAGGGTAPDLTLTVSVERPAFPAVLLNVTVDTEGDLITTNNTTSEIVSVLAPPFPQVVFTPAALAAGQQATMALTLSTGYPFDVTGTVTMTFSSNASNPLDDPAIRFENGQRQVNFTIPAFGLEARIAANPDPGPIAFQPGTVAGSLVFSGQLTAGTLGVIFPGVIGAVAVPVPAVAPVIQTPQVVLGPNGRPTEIQMTLSSTTRDITLITLNFLTTPKLRLSCGKTLRCSVDDTAITLDVKSFFDAWYAADTTFGGLSVLRLPITFDADVHGTIFIGIQNSAGFSNVVSFTLP